MYRTNKNEKLSYRRDSARRRSLRRSRSFKVTDLSTDRKPTYDFLLVNSTNTNTILRRFHVSAGYWSNFYNNNNNNEKKKKKKKKIYNAHIVINHESEARAVDRWPDGV